MSFLLDYIRIFDSALPEALCKELIDRFDKASGVTEALDRTEDGKMLVRSNLELDLFGDSGFKDLQEAMTKAAELAVGKYQTEIPVRTFPKELGLERFRIKKYRSGNEFDDHYSYHVDVNSHSSARRFLAMFWYLNDVEQGGETFFPHPNIRVKPKTGRLLLFPSLWNYPHIAEKPISNDKYVIGSYLHYL